VIKYLELRNWRAFEKVSLHLEPGTTFVVAENGIGKTSLLRGAAWALFAPSHIDPRVELRTNEGGNQTAGIVVVDTPHGELSVERSFAANSRPQSVLRAALGGHAIETDEVPTTVARLFGIDPPVACQLAFVHQHALLTDNELFAGVGQYLRKLTGVDQLEDNLAVLKKAHRRLSKQVTDITRAARATSTETSAIEAEIERHKLEEAALADELQSALDRDLRYKTRLDSIAGWNRYDEELLRYQTHRAQLDEEVASRLGPTPLETSISDLESSKASIESGRSVSHAAIDIHRQQSEQLTSVDSTCPLCQQSLDSRQLDAARSYHASAIAEAETNVVRYKSDLARLAAQLDDLRRLDAERRSLVAPLEPEAERPDSTSDLIDPTDEIETLNRRVAEARVSISTLSATVESERAAAAADRSLHLALRRDAATTAAIDVVQRSIDHHVREQIDPLSSAISHGWGQFFTDDGEMKLDAKGNVVLHRGELDPLPYAQLSGGQQMLAILNLRLTLVSAATDMGSVWLDEPLEHLDPINRRRAANLLVQVPNVDEQIQQILATTYEEETARRLAATNSTVELRYVRSD